MKKEARIQISLKEENGNSDWLPPMYVDLYDEHCLSYVQGLMRLMNVNNIEYSISVGPKEQTDEDAVLELKQEATNLQASLNVANNNTAFYKQQVEALRRELDDVKLGNHEERRSRAEQYMSGVVVALDKFRDERGKVPRSAVKKVDHIKQVRGMTGWSLKESKDFVEEYHYFDYNSNRVYDDTAVTSTRVSLGDILRQQLNGG